MLEIFYTFLRLGAISFGGPIAMVALIEREICHNKRWLSLEQFAEIFSVCKLLPGPLAIQVAVCCGFQRKGRLGGLTAGVAFMLPALALITLLSFLYVHNLNTNSKQLLGLFEFMQDATLAIILITIWDLGKSYIKNFATLIIALVCIGIIYVKPSYEPLVILLFGFAGVFCYKFAGKDLYQFPALLVASMPKVALPLLKSEVLYNRLFELFWMCIKAGEFSFGTGLAIIPLLQADLVSSAHWLTNKQFIDGVTLGQITPGPTTISIVFFGFLSAGVPGFLVSLFGFYIPPLFNALVIIPLFWKKLTASPYLKIFTMWAFPAVIGGIISATIKLGMGSIKGYLDIFLIILALFLIRKKVLPVWLIIPLYGVGGLILNIIHL